MRGIIIDGVTASGKTSVLKILKQSLEASKPEMSKIFLSEHYTQRMLEHKKESGDLCFNDVKIHINEILNSLKVYDAMLKKSKFNNDPRGAELLVVLERFFLTHMIELNLNNEEEKYLLNIYNELEEYNVKQFLLVIPEELMRDRIMSTLKYRNEYWEQFLYSLGKTEDDIVKYFIDWQRKMLSKTEEIRNNRNIKIIKIIDNDYQKISREIELDLLK